MRLALVAVLLCTCRAPEEPVDATSFTPAPWLPPETAQACSVDDIVAYQRACLAPATALPITCQQFTASHGACSACLLPPLGATHSGALRQPHGAVVPNTGGCIALLLNDARPEGCGAREQAALDCLVDACGAAPTPECKSRALAGACHDTQLHRCVELAGAARCSPTGDLALDYGAAAQLFCARD